MSYLYSICSINWFSISLSANAQYITALANYGVIYITNPKTIQPGTEFVGNVNISSKLKSTGLITSDSNINTNDGISSSYNYYPDGSLITTNFKNLDLIKIGYIYKNVGESLGALNWWRIAISATGQYQIISQYTNNYYYNSSNYGLPGSWIQLTNIGSTIRAGIVTVSATGQYQTVASYNVGAIYTSSSYGQLNTWVTSSNTISTQYSAMSASGKYQVICNWNGLSNFSSDYGITFAPTELKTLYGLPSTITVNTVAISVTGQYITLCASSETNKYIFVSKDYGNSWSYGITLSPDFQLIDCAMSASGQYQTVVTHTTVFISTDYGVSWNNIGLSGNWRSVSVSTSGQIQVTTNGPIYISTNYGLANTWYIINSAKNYTHVKMSSNGQYITAFVTGGSIYTLVTPELNTSCLSLTGPLFVNLDTSMNGNVYMSGNVGIGVQAPQAPLDVVAGSSKNANTATSYYFSGSTSTLTSGGNLLSNFSIYARGSILTAGSIVCANGSTFSDSRIKKNIVDVSNISTLELLDKLTPVKYNYIDTLTHSPDVTYGFIAQDVEKIIPMAVQQMNGYIPNIYEVAEISYNQLTLQNTNTNQFIFDLSRILLDVCGNTISPYSNPTDLCGNPIILKLYDNLNNVITTTLGTIIDDKNFFINDILDLSSVFLYGQEVSDFRVIDKDVIFSITTEGVRNLYTELKELKQTMANQQSQINTIMSMLLNK